MQYYGRKKRRVKLNWEYKGMEFTCPSSQIHYSISCYNFMFAYFLLPLSASTEIARSIISTEFSMELHLLLKFLFRDKKTIRSFLLSTMLRDSIRYYTMENSTIYGKEQHIAHKTCKIFVSVMGFLFNLCFVLFRFFIIICTNNTLNVIRSFHQKAMFFMDPYDATRD